MVDREGFMLQLLVQHPMCPCSVAHAMSNRMPPKVLASHQPSALALPHALARACARRCGGDVEEIRQTTRAYLGCPGQVLPCYANLTWSVEVDLLGWANSQSPPRLRASQSARDLVMIPFDSACCLLHVGTLVRFWAVRASRGKRLKASAKRKAVWHGLVPERARCHAGSGLLFRKNESKDGARTTSIVCVELRLSKDIIITGGHPIGACAGRGPRRLNPCGHTPPSCMTPTTQLPYVT